MRKFREAVQSGGFSICAELTPDLTLEQGFSAENISHQADLLIESVDGIRITENPWPGAQISAIYAADVLLQKGIDPIPHLDCRDRNRIALQSDLIGLRVLGVTSVLLTRGHHLPGEPQEQASSVHDTTSQELVTMANLMNEGPNIAREDHFFIGTEARAYRPEKWRAESLQANAKAGAQFLQFQLCLNTEIIRAYLDSLVQAKLTWKYSVFVSLAVLPSAETARQLRQAIPDARIPDELIKRLEDATDANREGINICVELMQEVAQMPGVSGINLMTMGHAELLPEIIQASGLRS